MMARYHVVFCDPNTEEIVGAVIRARHPVHAILQHPWICNIYKDEYVKENFAAEDEDNCRQNIYTFTSWRILCVNLDEEIMRDLNGGDSSASLATQPE
jgi:hypothetical protein